MKTAVAGEAGEVEELDVLLQAASEGSEDIRVERSWSRGRGRGPDGVFLEKLVKLKSLMSCWRLPGGVKTAVAGETGEVEELDVLLQGARRG